MTMVDIRPSDRQRLLNLAKQGDPKAIARMINARLKSLHITAKVGWKDECLGVLLEAEKTPPQQAMVRFIQQGIDNLDLGQMRALRIYGRQQNQATPEWREVIDYAVDHTVDDTLDYTVKGGGATDTAITNFSLMEWLSQGKGKQQLARPAALDNSPRFNDAIPTEQKFLRFCFSPGETALLPLNTIKEILKIPVSGILPVPHMPDCILGLYNCRGEMLWIADLGQQLGFPLSWPDAPLPTTVTVIVLQEEQATASATRTLAVMVPQVSSIETHNLQQLQPPTAALFSAQLLPFMKGYLTRSSSPVLQVSALIQDPALRVHSTILAG
jgi:positive phototaxis protein PixI